jgi:hypothetical protein
MSTSRTEMARIARRRIKGVRRGLRSMEILQALSNGTPTHAKAIHEALVTKCNRLGIGGVRAILVRLSRYGLLERSRTMPCRPYVYRITKKGIGRLKWYSAQPASGPTRAARPDAKKE